MDMKTKEKYKKPEIDIIEVILEGVIAGSEDELNIDGDHDGGPAGSKKRDFWRDEN